MKFESKRQLTLILIFVSVFLIENSNGAPQISYGQPQRLKRSPFLRLDELRTKLYLFKKKLGGGLINPYEVGKRSAVMADPDQTHFPENSTEDVSEPTIIEESSIEDNNLEQVFFQALEAFEQIKPCLNKEKCSFYLKELLEYENKRK